MTIKVLCRAIALDNNLPLQLTSFIGRERDVADIKRLLATTRLLTLSGPGGCGKTRLALQAAGELLEEYPNGVWWVDLGPLADPMLVPQAVASTLDVPEQPGRALIDTIVGALRAKQLLLVLDNCEHLLSACMHLANVILRGCPAVRILATSQEGFGIAGEVLYAVPSLKVPDPQRLPPAEQLTQYEAVQLLIDRATAVLPTFHLSSQNARAVAQVCHRLDGIPLAIELAAGRMKALPVEQIARRLDDRFRILMGGSRTALPRHRTLQAAMDWSYELLSEQERAVLRRLAVFAGGFTLEAAEAVCAGDGVGHPAVLDLLIHLVEKSFVVAEEQRGEARYRLLETVRQYARDRLLEAGETEAARRRHLDFYLHLAEQAEPGFRGPNQEGWLEWVGREHDNVRAALEWSREGGDGEAGLRLSGALWWFWYIRGYLSEGREWLEKVLSLSPSPSVYRARALLGAGLLEYRHSPEDASRLFEENLRLCRVLGDKPGSARALVCLGLTELRLGDQRRAKTHLNEGLVFLEEVDDRWWRAAALKLSGNISCIEGDYEHAAEAGGKSLQLFRELQDKYGIAISLRDMGELALCQGDYERAAELHEEGLSLRRVVGDQWGVAEALCKLGDVARLRGNHEHAREQYEESVNLFTGLGATEDASRALRGLGQVALAQGNPRRAAALLKESLALQSNRRLNSDVAECLEGLAGVAEAQERSERAARLLGAADALRLTIGVPRPPVERREYERRVARLREALGEDAFTAARTVGGSARLEEIIQYACAAPEPERIKDGTAKSARGRPSSLLTSRQVEVAALISKGLTNRQIAAALVISEKTAANHVQNIMNKLGFNSRAQIAAWVSRTGT